MSSESKEYTAQEVAAHKTAADAWVIIHGKVYNVTDYQHDHPGGAPVLVEAAGTDASDEFDNAGHSEDAFDVMAEYFIGALAGYVKKKERLRPVGPPPTQPTNGDDAAPKPSTAVTVAKISSLSLFSLAVAGLYYAHSRHAIQIPPWLLSQFRDRSGLDGPNGFIKGVLAGGAVFAALDAVVAHQFATKAWGTKSFTSYPPHMVVPKRVAEETLLQRGLLDPVHYAPLPLAEKKQISPNVYRFTFTLPTKTTVLGLPIGQHVAIKADGLGENADESVARSYTPVSNNSDLGTLELVVKIYPDGKLTQGYMAGLQPGDKVLFRGPKGAMRYHPGLCKEIAMVAGGSGITPMFQIIRAVCEHERDLTKISLIYANRTEEDILMREELDRFARRYPDQFRVYYMLDSPPKKGWKGGKGYVTKELMAEKLPEPKLDTKAMLCGPPGMVAAAKKGLVELGFEEPGASAKMTDQIFLF